MSTTECELGASENEIRIGGREENTLLENRERRCCEVRCAERLFQRLAVETGKALLPTIVTSEVAVL